MESREPTVFVVDDDEAVRESLELLFRSVGLPVESHESAHHFLTAWKLDRPGCLVLDVRMPGMSGLELQEKLAGMGATLPIIFITGHGDIPIAVRAMQSGAVDFIEKPFRDQDLLDRVHQALELQSREQERLAGRADIRQRLERLTPRELEVLDLVVQGNANKVIAGHLGLSQRTVEIHRAHIMRKMEADSLAELVRMVVTSQS